MHATLQYTEYQAFVQYLKGYINIVYESIRIRPMLKRKKKKVKSGYLPENILWMINEGDFFGVHDSCNMFLARAIYFLI